MWGIKVHTNKSDGMEAEGLGSILAARTPGCEPPPDHSTLSSVIGNALTRLPVAW